MLRLPGRPVDVHVICAHLGLAELHRQQQLELLCHIVRDEVPSDAPLIVAGDFNDWGAKLDAPMRALGLSRAHVAGTPASRSNTFPSRLPVFSMDRIYVRGLHCLSTSVPRGVAWARMSDHLPLVAELALD